MFKFCIQKKNNNKYYIIFLHFLRNQTKIKNALYFIPISCKSTARKRKKTQCILDLDHFLGNQTEQKRKDKNVGLRMRNQSTKKIIIKNLLYFTPVSCKPKIYQVKENL